MCLGNSAMMYLLKCPDRCLKKYLEKFVMVVMVDMLVMVAMEEVAVEVLEDLEVVKDLVTVLASAVVMDLEEGLGFEMNI